MQFGSSWRWKYSYRRSNIMCTTGIPVEIQTPTNLNVLTVLPPVLSPNNILLPPSSHCSLISEKKIWRDFYLTLLPLQNCVCWAVHIILDELQASPWLRWLVTSILPREPEFDPGSIRVWFVVGRVAGDQVLLSVMKLSPVSIAPSLLLSNIHLCALPIRRANFRNFRVT